MTLGEKVMKKLNVAIVGAKAEFCRWREGDGGPRCSPEIGANGTNSRGCGAFQELILTHSRSLAGLCLSCNDSMTRLS